MVEEGIGVCGYVVVGYGRVEGIRGEGDNRKVRGWGFELVGYFGFGGVI